MTPLLDHCPATLPRAAYLEADWHARELATIWARNWVCVGRLGDLANWPMDSLVTKHRHERTLKCNWKVFWENYNECLHCPGIHPELCDMVPIYAQGIMAPNESPHRTPDQPRQPNLKPGAHSWTLSGAPCGPTFPNLTPDQPETLSQPGFDAAHVAAHVAAYAKIVLQQDGDAVEMNQRGIRSPAYQTGALMPQEFDIQRFHTWVLAQMEATA